MNWESDCVIPFNVKKAVCTDLFYSWVKELWFAPSDMSKNAILQPFKMVYVPYWLFEVDTVSRYIIGIFFFISLLWLRYRSLPILFFF